MPDSFQALGVFLLALLPGALYTWAVERQAGAWGVSLGDRVLRFIGASAVLQAALAPGTYELYRRFWQSGDLAAGRALPWWFWLVVCSYAAAPLVAGSIVGAATRQRRPWVRWLVGPAAAPRAYDHLFARSGVTGWVRIRLKGDLGWIVGAYAAESADGLLASYASGYPEAQELFLADTAVADAEGNLVLDDDGEVQLRGVAALVRLDEAAYLEWSE